MGSLLLIKNPRRTGREYRFTAGKLKLANEYLSFKIKNKKANFKGFFEFKKISEVSGLLVIRYARVADSVSGIS